MRSSAPLLAGAARGVVPGAAGERCEAGVIIRDSPVSFIGAPRMNLRIIFRHTILESFIPIVLVLVLVLVLD
jgi:hypothetical protein